MQAFIDDLIETMNREKGIGIAAPQTGVCERLIVVCRDPYRALRPEVYVNPRIVKRSWRTVESEEGCLSVPGVTGVVERHKHIRIEAMDRTGQALSLRASNLLAFVFQHEMDHLDGVLFFDRAKRISQKPSRSL
jgi:peptide deformylase